MWNTLCVIAMLLYAFKLPVTFFLKHRVFQTYKWVFAQARISIKNNKPEGLKIDRWP